MQKWNMRCIAVQSAQDTHATYGIVQRTESDWVANGIRSDGGRNLIGWRTESDRTANGIRWQREHFQGALLGGALVSSAPTELHQQSSVQIPHRIRGTHRTFWQRKPPTDRHRLGGYDIPAIPTLPITQPNILWIP